MTCATHALRPRGAARLQAWEGGSGPPVTLLHGLGGSSANWVEVLPLLLPERRVLALDLPGHGRSAPLAAPADLDAYVDAVAEAMDAGGHRRALVVGHSFGGHVAARLALRHPERVRGLLLVCPSGISSRRRVARIVLAVTLRLRPARRVRPLALRLGGQRWFRRAVFGPWVAGNVGEVSRRAVRGLVWDTTRHTDLRSAVRAMTADEPRAWLGEVRAPSVVLWGADDVQLALEDAFEIARRLRAQLRVAAGCGHLAIVERPDAVVDALHALHERAGQG